MKFYITVNPHGGAKKGPGLLKKVKPIFDNANVELTIIETMFAGHAKELAEQLNFEGYDGLISIGGDGTLHEVVNGIMYRKDDFNLPIGLIPGGSGNSFMHDLDLVDPIEAAKAIIKGNTCKVDLAEVKINHVTKYAINIIGWGLVTDIANKAEKYRWMGTSRYTVLSVLEVFTYSPRPAALVIGNKRISDDFTFIIACNTIHTGKGMKMAPKAKLDDGLMDIIVVKHKASRLKLLSMLPKVFEGTHINHPLVEYYKASEFSLIPKEDEILNIDGEIAGSTPIDVKVIPKKIEIFCK
jgi:diacylglycerol kinase (ATP)